MVKAVLFDLDGTLADTAPDLGYALNCLRLAHGLAKLPLEQIRPQASNGARGLLKLGFDLDTDNPSFPNMRQTFLNLYEENLCRETTLFPGIPELLTHLEVCALPWGIVTNKPSRFTLPLLKQLGLDARAACIISGDTCAHPKPHPAPLLAGCEAIAIAPQHCVYVGDDLRDVQAGQAAGTRTIVATYGYLGSSAHPLSWGADGVIDHPQDLIAYL